MRATAPLAQLGLRLGLEGCGSSTHKKYILCSSRGTTFMDGMWPGLCSPAHELYGIVCVQWITHALNAAAM